MVLFTLTGLNVDVGLYEFIEYPTYDFPDISASYYLDLSFNPIYFDNIFYFKTTNPDLLDFNNNVRLLFNSSNTIDIDPTSDNYGGNIWTQAIPITYATDQWTSASDFNNTNKEHQKKPEDFKLRAEQLHGRLLTTSEMINVLNSDSDVSTLLKTKTGISSVNSTISNRYVCTFNPPQDNYSEGVFEFVNVDDSTIHTESSVQGSNQIGNLFTGGNTGYRAALVYYTDYYDYDPDGPEIIKDMAFKCESSYWPDISFSEGIITNASRSDINNYLPPPSANGINYNKNIGVQWLAKNITGGYNNSDLFANEEALVQQYVELDAIKGFVPSANQFFSNFLNKKYKYYRAIFPTINTTVISDPSPGFIPDSSHQNTVSVVYINIISDGIEYSLNNISASNEWSLYRANKIGTPPSDSVNNMWLSGQAQDKYDSTSGNYTGSSITTTNTINLSGEWVQWEHDNPINISLFKIRTGGMFYTATSTYIGIPPSRIVLVGRNNENDNWDIIYDNTYPFQYKTYTIVFGKTIKGNITNTLDVSGGTDAAPLSNADVGRNNVSREVLLHLLDNDVSANVQRVHNMIAKSQTNVDSNGNDISFGDTSNLWIPIEFFDSDTIKFKLIYKPDQITDGSGVATDDSGNALGTNTIEDQDYVVRLNIVGYRFQIWHTYSVLTDDISSNNFTNNNQELVHLSTNTSSPLMNIDSYNPTAGKGTDGGGGPSSNPFDISYNIDSPGTFITLGGYYTDTSIPANIRSLWFNKYYFKNIGQTASNISAKIATFTFTFILRFPSGTYNNTLDSIYGGGGGNAQDNTVYIFGGDNVNNPYQAFSIYFADQKYGIYATDAAVGPHRKISCNMSRSTLNSTTETNWRVLSYGFTARETALTTKIYENGILLDTIEHENGVLSGGTFWGGGGNFLNDLGSGMKRWYMGVHPRSSGKSDFNAVGLPFDLAGFEIFEGITDIKDYMNYIRNKYPNVTF